MKQSLTTALIALLLVGCTIIGGCSSSTSYSYSPEFQERQALLAQQDSIICNLSNEMAAFRSNSSNTEALWNQTQWSAFNRLLEQYNLAIQHKQDLIDQYMANPTRTTTVQNSQSNQPRTIGGSK